MSNSGSEQNQFKRNNRNNFENNRFNSRNRFGGNRENSGFRIRLSENEMKATKIIQEKFQLKSTVAVLGFAVRTLSELVKDEDLKDILSKYVNENENKKFSYSNNSKVSGSEKKAPSPDPFARPIRDQISKTTPKENENGDEN
tara:strand:- start:41 stop:469 length:429 start_codon:yes stop_codon:yes gene_type:complete